MQLGSGSRPELQQQLGWRRGHGRVACGGLETGQLRCSGLIQHYGRLPPNLRGGRRCIQREASLPIARGGLLWDTHAPWGAGGHKYRPHLKLIALHHWIDLANVSPCCAVSSAATLDRPSGAFLAPSTSFLTVSLLDGTKCSGSQGTVTVRCRFHYCLPVDGCALLGARRLAVSAADTTPVQPSLATRLAPLAPTPSPADEDHCQHPARGSCCLLCGSCAC